MQNVSSTLPSAHSHVGTMQGIADSVHMQVRETLCKLDSPAEVLCELHEHYIMNKQMSEHKLWVYDFALPMLVLQARLCFCFFVLCCICIDNVASTHSRSRAMISCCPVSSSRTVPLVNNLLGVHMS
jgi:hypothetical protein